MTEMIERVARAMCVTAGTNPDAIIDVVNGPSADWSEQAMWKGWERFARAAIAAMREPTGAMVAAGWDDYRASRSAEPSDAADVWRSMLDAALSV